MEAKTKKTWFENIWDRKVLQYLGTYLAVGFGLLQFLEFITSRYDLGGNLVDKYLLVWVALLPAVSVFAYYSLDFRSSTVEKAPKWSKFFIIFNILIAFILGGFLFNNSLSAQGEVVEITDEEGKSVRAVIPSMNKVKSLAIFQFENLTEDESLDWWSIAFSTLLSYNLEQRPEYYTNSGLRLNGYYDQLGLTSFEIPSVGMQREVAQKSRNDYFTRISYQVVEDKFEMKGNLYSSRDGKAIVEIDVINADPYQAIDQVKEQIVENIPDAFQQTENQTDLPASTLISNNSEALRYHTSSRITYYKNPAGLQAVVDLARKAVEIDPTCSICHFYLGDPLYGQGKRDEAISAIKTAIKYGVSLPDRMQFGAKSVLYSITNKMESYIKLQEVKRTMFPYDFSSYQQLLNVYRTNYGIDSAKFLMQEAIQNGNLERGLLELFDLQLANEEFVEGEKTLDRFGKEFPDRDQERLRYARLYEEQGKIEKAKAFLLEEETLDPFDAGLQTRLAYIDFKDLNFKQAYERLDEGIEQATTLSDSIAYLAFKQYFLQKNGRIKEGFEVVKEYERQLVKRTPINRIVLQNFNIKADMYNSIGQSEKVPLLLDEIDKYSPDFRNRYHCSNIINILERDYKADFTEEELLACRSEYESVGEGFQEYFDLIISYYSRDFKQCLEMIEGENQKIKKLLSNKFFLANIYDQAGESKKAIETLKTAIDRKPDEADYYYKLAVLFEKENPASSSAFLEKALKFWSGADAEFIPYKKAREMASSLSL